MLCKTLWWLRIAASSSFWSDCTYRKYVFHQSYRSLQRYLTALSVPSYGNAVRFGPLVQQLFLTRPGLCDPRASVLYPVPYRTSTGTYSCPARSIHLTGFQSSGSVYRTRLARDLRALEAFCSSTRPCLCVSCSFTLLCQLKYCSNCSTSSSNAPSIAPPRSMPRLMLPGHTLNHLYPPFQDPWRA